MELYVFTNQTDNIWQTVICNHSNEDHSIVQVIARNAWTITILEHNQFTIFVGSSIAICWWWSLWWSIILRRRGEFDSTAVRDQLQLIEPCAGDEALNVFYPIQVENLLSDQRVETPELPTYQQGDCALHNGLSSPTPEPAVQDTPPPADSLVGYPVQESDQDVRGSHLVQETSGLRLLRGYDQSRCQQQTNDFQINGVSSLGENDQAIQQSCTMQEMRLWKKEITKQVSLGLKNVSFT